MRDAGRRLEHPGLRRRRRRRTRRRSSRPATRARSPTRSSTLLADEERRVAMGRAARALAEERYAWPDVAAAARGDLRARSSREAARGRWRPARPGRAVRGRDLADLVARARLAPRPRHVHGRPLAVGRRSPSALNLLSVVVRALAWNTVIRQAIAAPRPGVQARLLGVLRRAVRERGAARAASASSRASPCSRGGCRAARASGATLIGTVFAHRMFDLFPTIALVVWVLSFARSCRTGRVMTIVVVLGDRARALRVRGRRRPRATAATRSRTGSGRVRVAARARAGRARRDARAGRRARPRPRFQFLGWFCQLLAVYAAMHALPDLRAARRRRPRAADDERRHRASRSGPGTSGSSRRRSPSRSPSTASATREGFAFGIGLQLIEASVGIGIGTVFLAREGLSYAMLKTIEEPVEATEEVARPPRSPNVLRSRVPG